MGRDPKGFDTETLPHESRLPAVSAARTPVVRIAWEDIRGSHDERVERSAIIGASPGAAICVDDPLVSRLHAEITVEASGVWVRDLTSKNGTFVEGVRIAHAQVPAGGRVRVGATLLRVTESFDETPASIGAGAWPSEEFGMLVGRSAAMRDLFARMARVAAANAPVLIQGETGVGKELVARTIHERSSAASGPFVVVDCAMFTGRELADEGLVMSARGGTLFLDEVADLPLAAQPALLRALEAAKTGAPIRFISSTQRDLPKLVAEGAFREDLYFRLSVLPLVVPPLRERTADIPRLVEAFLPAREHGAITPALLDELRARPWRGNVRELRNFVERALAFGTEEAIDLLPKSEREASDHALPAVGYDEPFKVLRDRWVNHLEREYLRGVLARTGGNVSAAAEAAGLDRAYVYRLIRKHGL